MSERINELPTGSPSLEKQLLDESIKNKKRIHYSNLCKERRLSFEQDVLAAHKKLRSTVPWIFNRQGAAIFFPADLLSIL